MALFGLAFWWKASADNRFADAWKSLKDPLSRRGALRSAPEQVTDAVLAHRS